MKINHYFTLLFLGAFSFSMALTGQARQQPTYDYGYERVPAFGIKGGLNFSDITDNDDPREINARTGFHAGIFYEIPLARRLSLRPEVLYSTKGSELDYHTEFLGIELISGESTFNMNYIDVPLYLVIYLTDHFNIFAGPYAGFLINTNVTTQSEILDFLEIGGGDEIDRDHFNSMDYGLSAGLGFLFGNLSLSANYGMGLLQVADSGVSESLLGDSRNKFFQVSLGIRF
jgi:hypothetical protein